MIEHPDFPPHDADADGEFGVAGPAQRSNQQIAHDRGRICKKRACPVCAPLRARRKEKRKQRTAEAQAALHDKKKPCGRASCEIDICVRARAAAEATAATASNRTMTGAAASRPEANDTAVVDPAAERRRQDAKHRLGLPCGSETCVVQLCLDGFANERIRRHRKGRPCRSTTCSTPICVAARTTT